MAKRFKAGQIVRFTYNHERIDEWSGDKFKEVFVLHPHWRGTLHAIDLKRLTVAEREVIDAIFDPATKPGRHRLSLVNDILRRMKPIEEVKNPQSFYQKFVKVFLRNKDAYRQYKPDRMMNATVVKQTKVEGNVINPKPLFHKVESKQVATPQGIQSLHGKVKQMDPETLARIAKQMGVDVSSKAGQQQHQKNIAAIKAQQQKKK